MGDHLVTLGAASFVATQVRIGQLPRAVGISANALAQYPVETTDYVSGYRQITITGYLQGIDTLDESAADHLDRLWTNLETEVAKDANTLTIDFGATSPRVYTVKKSDGGIDLGDLPRAVRVHHRLNFSVTLNCLP